MHRQMVYPGAIPLETDILYTNKFAMVALGMLSQAILGTTTQVDGLTCSPTSPASMQVTVSNGSIYSIENVDSSAYSSLAADTTDQIVKQGIALAPTTLSCPAPATAGQSVVYLIEAAYEDVDGGATVLPYYNASNPAVAYNGPGGAGTSNNTVRQGLCVIQAKAGVAATTGSQVTPAVDAGFTALWTVTVANGQTTITSGNIAAVAGAPFIGAKLTGRLSAANNLSDLANIATAIANLGFSQTVGNPFSLTLPGGLIIKGGFFSNTNPSGTPMTFATPFPTTCYLIIGIDNGGTCKPVGAGSLSASGCTFYQRDPTASGAAVAGGIYWLAIGK